MEITESPSRLLLSVRRFASHIKAPKWSLFFICGLLLLPTLSIVASLWQPFSDVWTHLSSTVLDDYLLNSLWLMLGVAVGTLVLGVATAWLTSMCEFRGRKHLQWALLLPMALPAYILAYSYTGLLDFAGPVQSSLRDWFDWRYGDYWFPEIRSLGGAIAMLSLVLYPYVYLIVRTSFIEQSRAILEVSRSLGNSQFQTFWRVAIPAARPAIVAGLTLVLMETLADYGTVKYFGVSTFTTGIFRTWFGMGELTSAAQLSSLLLMFVFSLMLIERWSRRRMKFHAGSRTERKLQPIRLTGWRQVLAMLACSLPLVLGFIVPSLQLFQWAWLTGADALDKTFFALVSNSFLLAAMAAGACLLVSLWVCFFQRRQPHFSNQLLVRGSTLGYAIPGTVIAVGVLLPFAAFDNWLDAQLVALFDISSGLLLSGSLIALVFAYMVRFMSVSVQTIEAGFSKFSRHVDDAANTLGSGELGLFGRVHFPLLKTSMLTAVLLVFVDVLKELPTTLILRPFNFNTLAVRAYEMASDERLMDAALPAIAIMVIGLIPVVLLTRAMQRKH